MLRGFLLISSSCHVSRLVAVLWISRTEKHRPPFEIFP